MLQDNRITVLIGHAGTGKTNVALHLAREMAAAGHATILADLDTVNPYFRASDYPELLEGWGVRLVAPVFARTTLDTPSLTGELDAVIGSVLLDHNARLVVDVGGDDDGATTIGRFSRRLEGAGAEVLYVVSGLRILTQTPQEAASMLPDIEAHAHLRATGVLNSTNLSTQTTLEMVRDGRAFARECAGLLGLPLVATAVPQVAADQVPAGQSLDECIAPSEPRHEEFTVLPKYVGIPWE